MICRAAAQRACEAVVVAEIMKKGSSLLEATEVGKAAALLLGDLAEVGTPSLEQLDTGRYFGRPAKRALAILEGRLGRHLSGLGTAADAVAKSPMVKDAKAERCH